MMSAVSLGRPSTPTAPAPITVSPNPGPCGPSGRAGSAILRDHGESTPLLEAVRSS